MAAKFFGIARLHPLHLRDRSAPRPSGLRQRGMPLTSGRASPDGPCRGENQHRLGIGHLSARWMPERPKALRPALSSPPSCADTSDRHDPGYPQRWFRRALG